MNTYECIYMCVLIVCLTVLCWKGITEFARLVRDDERSRK